MTVFSTEGVTDEPSDFPQEIVGNFDMHNCSAQSRSRIPHLSFVALCAFFRAPYF
jgi:hypothetical protein